MQQLEKGTRKQVFDYQQFLLILDKIQQDLQESTQHVGQGGYNQKLLNQFKCMIVGHKDKQIEGICINKECGAQNRRTCYDCILKNVHGKDEESNQQNNCNADQLNDIIKQYKTFMNKQIDSLEYQLYFEQLQLTVEKNDYLAYKQLQKLNKIDHQIQEFKLLIDKINLQEYIQQQHIDNIGIYQYLQQKCKQLQLIQNIIELYQRFKNQLKNFQAEIKESKMDNKDVQELQDIRKKKHLIIKNIINTQIYQTNGIDNKDKLFINDQTCDLYEFGKRLAKKNQDELAIEYFDLHISQNSNDSIAYFLKGNSLYKLKQYEEAIQIYDMALKLNPQYLQAYYNKGGSLENLKRFEEAIQMYDKAINLNPQNSQAYYNKGVSLENLKRFEEAIQMYDKAINLNPQNSQAYYNKGVSLRNLKRFEEAEISFVKAKEIQDYS